MVKKYQNKKLVMVIFERRLGVDNKWWTLIFALVLTFEELLAC